MTMRDLTAGCGTTEPRRMGRLTRQVRRLTKHKRRGVVSVLAMMFLILFGSLAAAMAITSRGNIMTAATHQHVSRAMGAAETGMTIAEQRLREAAGRFVVEKGRVDESFGWKLWSGTMSSGDGLIQRLAPTSFIPSGSTPTGLVDAVAQAHLKDKNIVVIGGVSTPTIGPAPEGTDESVYMTESWLRTPGVALSEAPGGKTIDTAFQIEYAPLANGTDVRVIVTGYDFNYITGGAPITRRISQDFRLVKRVRSALMSPSKIMIGKNVLIEGNLGALYSSLAAEKGDPLVLKSDFYGIDATLNTRLDKLYAALKTSDQDKDNRLRVGHPVEGPAIPDFEGSGSSTGSAADVNEDGYVDEMDCFLSTFDTNPKDGKVVLSAALAVGTPAEGLAAEFIDKTTGKPLDDDLGLLLDSAAPDRNRNGILSFVDVDGDGRFNPAVDKLVDTQPASGAVPVEWQKYIKQTPDGPVVWADQVLGYRDGVIDTRDLYAKVSGRLVFKVTAADWTASQGDYMAKLRGPIAPRDGLAPVQFEAPTKDLPELSAASFSSSGSALKAIADGDGKAFSRQVADSLNISESQLASWTASMNPTDPTKPRHFPISPDANGDGLPDNWQDPDAYFEKTPFNSPSFSDYYYRPVYENMVFRNVQIPEGTNALFRNCTFVGVTYVKSRLDNSHVNWTRYGKLKLNTASPPRAVLDPPRYIYGDDAGETSFPKMLAASDRPVLMVVATEAPLDKADIPDAFIATTQGYANLPEPLIIDGKRCVDSKKVSNNVRFHDCLFVGSIVSDAPQVYTHVRNKLQFTGATRFTDQHPKFPEDSKLNPDPADMPEIKKSSMMLPQYSVDVGSFNSPSTQDVHLTGAIIAGVLDVRGNASINGALLLTFKPELGKPPLTDAFGASAGNPSLFNASIGYFGPEDGDEESLDPTKLPKDAGGQRYVGWDLDGDGIADLGPDKTPTPAQIAAGAKTVPFHGYGGVNIRFDPNMVMPDGIMLPLEIDVQKLSYKEGSK